MDNINLTFIFNNKEIKIQAKRDEYMNEIFKRYALKTEQKINDIYFIYNAS